MHHKEAAAAQFLRERLDKTTEILISDRPDLFLVFKILAELLLLYYDTQIREGKFKNSIADSDLTFIADIITELHQCTDLNSTEIEQPTGLVTGHIAAFEVFNDLIHTSHPDTDLPQRQVEKVSFQPFFIDEEGTNPALSPYGDINTFRMKDAPTAKQILEDLTEGSDISYELLPTQSADKEAFIEQFKSFIKEILARKILLLITVRKNDSNPELFYNLINLFRVVQKYGESIGVNQTRSFFLNYINDSSEVLLESIVTEVLSKWLVKMFEDGQYLVAFAVIKEIGAE